MLRNIDNEYYGLGQIREYVVPLRTDGTSICQSYKGENTQIQQMQHSEEFDAVLVDAPCSSERHWIQYNQGYDVQRDQWSVSRSKRNQRQQYLLLKQALRCTKVGGRIVYCTCSISPLENEKLVQLFLNKNGKYVELLQMGSNSRLDVLCKEAGVEELDVGWRCYPDVKGWGPLFWVGFLKTQSFLT
eukprot:TRINITY_DN10132_c1_g1_i1.p3 TRINITY_DN10132_c1_g1~~TRINITY_DN10132_c1_g1_i1.p3  ORF type:complete len:187 (-),score=18.77 TRINITY_DN10132_c1_g1_i1:52-612(-)